MLHLNWMPQDTPYPLFLATCYRNYNIPWRKYKEIQKKNALTNFAWVILLQYFLLLNKLAEPPIVFSSYDFIIAINLCFLLKIFKLLTIIIIAIIYLACHFYSKYVYSTKKLEIDKRSEKITTHQYIRSLPSCNYMSMMQSTEKRTKMMKWQFVS